MREKKEKLDTRSKLLYSTAVVGFVAGWVITFWGFTLPPEGVIDNTVIVVLGQAMTYSATAFGVDKFIDYKIYRRNRKYEEEEEKEEA